MLDRYRWANEDHDLSWTVAAVEGRTEPEVIRAYGGDPDHPLGSMTFADTLDLVPEEELGEWFVIQTMTTGRHVVVLENNGWLGARPELAERVTAKGGKFFSVQWSPVASRIVQAENGKVLADFEPLFTDQDTAELVPQWAHEAVFAAEGLRAAMLAAMEEQAWVGFEPRWLGEDLAAYRVQQASG
jgi:hypothetical protein